MRKLNRYLFSTMTASILMVLAVILGFDAISGVIDEMADVNDSYNFVKALRFVLMSMPGNVFELMPFAALVGCLAGLGSLAGNSELVVVRAAGVSTGRIVWMVMRPTIVIMLVGTVISEFIAPYTESIAKTERAVALRNDENLVSREGLWHREGNNFMHFNVVQPNGVLNGVTIYSFDDERHLINALYAQRAIFQSKRWVLEDVVESQLLGDRIERTVVSSRNWSTALTPDLLGILVLQPIDLSIKGLWDYSAYLDGQGLHSGPYRLAFWKKVLQPLSTLALVLIAISFIFGPLREVTMGFRIFVGVLIGIVFRTAQDMLAPASLMYGFQPIFASLLPIVICTLVGLELLRRAR